MKILVTGATGFIGTNLISELLKDPNNIIIATSRNITKAKKCNWFTKVKYIEHDLKNNVENLYAFFQKPEKVIHLAWEGLENYNNLTHIEDNLFNNYKFIKNLIVNGLKDILITGTCFEYGMINGCLSEDIQTKPANAYAIAKDTLRKFIIELSKNYDFQYKWVRLFYMYGKGQSKKSLMSLLGQAILNKDNEFNMSAGEQLRDFLHINEVVKNINLINKQNIYVDQAINCCSGEPKSVRSLVESYLKQKNYNMQLNLGYFPYPNYEPMAFWGDNAKLQRIKELQ